MPYGADAGGVRNPARGTGPVPADEFDFDANDILHVRVDRRRKMLANALLAYDGVDRAALALCAEGKSQDCLEALRQALLDKDRERSLAAYMWERRAVIGRLTLRHMLLVSLALLAAASGFCAGCEAYKLGYRLTGRRFVSCPIPPAPGRVSGP